MVALLLRLPLFPPLWPLARVLPPRLLGQVSQLPQMPRHTSAPLDLLPLLLLALLVNQVLVLVPVQASDQDQDQDQAEGEAACRPRCKPPLPQLLKALEMRVLLPL